VALLSRFVGGTVSNGAGFAFGRASSPVLAPAIEKIRQEAWRTYPDYPLDAGTLATGVAQGQVDPAWAKDEALNNGVNGERFDRLVDIANVGPGMASAFDLWRRGIIPEARFRAALKRGGIEDEWIDDLVRTKDILLSPAELANAVVQGHMSQAAATAEAELQGVTADRFAVLVANTGLPPGPETLLAWLRRGIITQAQFETGILEGHTKPKYIPFYEAARAPVLGATEYANLWLRGWISDAERDAGGELTGYTAEQMDLLSKDRGRPATTHQVHIGFVRGGRLPGVGNNERATFSRAVKESNIRPEWEDILWAQRYSYPSAFVLRALVQSGDITRAEGEQALLFSGWEPTFAAKVSQAWAGGGTTATANPRVKRAQDQVFNAAHRSYLDATKTRAEVTAALERIGLDAATAGQVIDLWDAENAILVKPLTPSQIKKAYTSGEIQVDDATARLVAQQWSTADAALYLQS
jgi:hypothetical protein